MKEILIHIGYPKTGSSWLQKYIFNSESMKIKNISRGLILKEIFSPHDLDFNIKNTATKFNNEIQNIKDNGYVPVISHELLSGHPKSGGYNSFQIALRLKSIFPNAKILIVIRNQIDMIYSSYVQYIKVGGTCSISRFLTPPEDYRIPLFDYKYFEYHRLIGLYIELFNRDNVLALPYELFVHDPENFLKKISEFSDIEIHESKKQEDFVNRNMASSGILFKRFVNYFINHKTSVHPGVPILVGNYLSAKISGFVRRFSYLIPNSLNKSIKNNYKIKIQKFTAKKYDESNVKTSQLIDIDLSYFKYPLNLFLIFNYVL